MIWIKKMFHKRTLSRQKGSNITDTGGMQASQEEVATIVRQWPCSVFLIYTSASKCLHIFSGERSLSSCVDFNVQFHVNRCTFVLLLQYITHSPLRSTNQNPQVLSDLLASTEIPETSKGSVTPGLSDTQCSVNVILFSKSSIKIDFLHPIKGCVKSFCRLVFFGWVISVHYILFAMLQQQRKLSSFSESVHGSLP